MNTTYLKSISILRKITLASAFFCGALILLGRDFYPSLLPTWIEYNLWTINSITIFMLMCIRPLADITPQSISKWIRPLIAYRKELGIFSAMIVVMFGMAKYIYWGWSDFFEIYFSADYWRFEKALFWGHIGELVGLILLITSNTFSQKILKKYWKYIQRLSYIYFYTGGYYVYIAFEKPEELWFMGIVTILTLSAWGYRYWRKIKKEKRGLHQ